MKLLLRLRNNRGVSPLTSLILIVILILVFFFAFEWYSVYTVSSSIHSCFERSVKTITTLNEVYVYRNIRENMMELDDYGIASLLTVDELTDEVCGELGLEREGNALVKRNSTGNKFYSISDVDVDAYYVSDTNTICFETTGVIEIPLSIMKGSSFTTIRLDLKVKSMYASTLRAES